jgi:hypothetical protein
MKLLWIAAGGLSLTLALAFAACQHGGAGGASGSTGGDTGSGGDAGAPCPILFGQPNAQTGLDASQCQPRCDCNGTTFEPPTYSAAFIQSLVDDWQLATPYPPLTSDPYAAPVPPDDAPGTVCGVLPQGDAGSTPRAYTLVTYASAADAQTAGAMVTHFGHCAVCSTLANLAVYMRNDDLTAPVRACALVTSADGGNGDVGCLLGLGFDLPCAQAWAYDTAHTESVCLSVCLANSATAYNEPDGALNPCIACDEDQSGPVFKAVAGRTRRNSGIPNAICRPCSQVQPLVHAY